MVFKGQIPERLRKAIHDRSCLLFVGAGASAGVSRSNGKPLPNWPNLLLELIDLANSNGIYVPDEANIRILIGADELLDAGQAIRDAMGDDLQSAFNTIFGDHALRPNQLHTDLTILPFAGMLTTNYDALLEGARTLQTNGVRPLTFTQVDYDATKPSPLRDKLFFILKAHGDYQNVSTVVLGTKDYEKIMYFSPGYRFFMERAFSDYTILFVGYGNSDPELNEIIAKVSALAKNAYDPHFLLLPDGRVSPQKRNALRRNVRLQVIEYEHSKDHSQVSAFIETLVSDHVFPQSRVSSLIDVRVLISYRTLTSAVAEKIADILDAKGYRYCLHDASVTANNADYRDLQRRIGLSDRLITLHGDQSDMPIAIILAEDGNKPILPIVVGTDKIPAAFGSRPYLRWDNPSICPCQTEILEFVEKGA